MRGSWRGMAKEHFSGWRRNGEKGQRKVIIIINGMYTTKE